MLSCLANQNGALTDASTFSLLTIYIYRTGVTIFVTSGLWGSFCFWFWKPLHISQSRSLHPCLSTGFGVADGLFVFSCFWEDARFFTSFVEPAKRNTKSFYCFKFKNSEWILFSNEQSLCNFAFHCFLWLKKKLDKKNSVGITCVVHRFLEDKCWSRPSPEMNSNHNTGCCRASFLHKMAQSRNEINLQRFHLRTWMMQQPYACNSTRPQQRWMKYVGKPKQNYEFVRVLMYSFKQPDIKTKLFPIDSGCVDGTLHCSQSEPAVQPKTFHCQIAYCTALQRSWTDNAPYKSRDKQRVQIPVTGGLNVSFTCMPEPHSLLPFPVCLRSQNKKEKFLVTFEFKFE